MTQPTLNIFSHKINPRLIYSVNEVFTRRLGWEVKLITDAETFVELDGPKLNYSDRSFEKSSNILQLSPAQLLFEKRIQPQEHDAAMDGDLLRLFPLKHHHLGFDPLAASFYHLSRYEEYLPHRKDDHGRFLEEDFLVIKHKCEAYPHVERYAQLLGEWVNKAYPSLKLPISDKAEHLVTLDVDQLYALKYKGLARTVFGTLKDALKGRLGRRISVLLGTQKDPNDIYDEVLASCSEHQVKPLLFFQVGEGSRYDQNNPPHLSSVKDRMNRLALRSSVGVHPSYYSSEQQTMLQKEIERLRSIVASPVMSSRQHYLRFSLPDTFRKLQECGIEMDYSLGFTTTNGFRAATCKAFRGFDLEREDIMDITFVPSIFMDLAAVRKFLRTQEAVDAGKRLFNTVRSFGGTFVSTWHPEVLTGQGVEYPSMPILMELLQHD
jgi:hypothetical protein